MSERRKKSRWRKAERGGDVAEGGCCLLEFFAAATCLVGLALIPLLMR